MIKVPSVLILYLLAGILTCSPYKGTITHNMIELLPLSTIYKCSGFYFYQFKHFKINLEIKVDSLVRRPNKTNIDFRAI